MKICTVPITLDPKRQAYPIVTDAHVYGQDNNYQFDFTVGDGDPTPTSMTLTVFTDAGHKAYDVTDSKWTVPSELLGYDGTVTAEVVANYEDGTDNVQRFSFTITPSAVDGIAFTGLTPLTAEDAVKQALADDPSLFQGVTGVKGDKGDKGNPGPVGPVGPQGVPGKQGDPGPQGVPGTAGKDGESAYQLAVAGGYTGTQTDWLASLKGPKGDQGDTGLTGPQGVPGKQGDPGPKGEPGVAGKDGESAYQVAVDGGFSGTEAEWLASLKGQKGDQGDPGPKGDPGDAASVDLSPYLKTTDAAAEYQPKGDYALKSDLTSTSSGVQSVNGVKPDITGNVTIDAQTSDQVKSLIKAALGGADGIAFDSADGSADNLIHLEEADAS